MKTFQLLLMFCLMTFAGPSFASFGYSGSSGSDGYRGSNGTDAQPVITNANSAQSYVLNGTDGTGGGDGSSGSSASSCYQSQGHSDEYGASGGNGGDGGDGGRGGDGGDVTIFYKNISELSSIYIENEGGNGAPGGSGSYGGDGCSCSTYSWSHTTCSDVERCSTSENCTSQRICEETGETRTEGGVSAPVRRCFDRRSCNPVRSCHTENVCNTESYSCSSGSDGSHGSTGSYGRHGYWGNIRLVKDITAIPAQSFSASVSLAESLRVKTKLTKQIWEERNNGKEIFANGSIISGNYSEFVKLAKRDFIVVWEAERDFTELGAVSFDIQFDGTKIAHKTKGEVFFESTVTETETATVLTITNAYKTSELRNLEIQSTRGYGSQLKITIRDKEALNLIVKSEVSLQFVYRRTFGGWRVAFDGKIDASKMKVFADRIEIRVGDLGIDPKFIKKRRRVRYTLNIKRSFGDNSTNVELFQDKIKLC